MESGLGRELAHRLGGGAPLRGRRGDAPGSRASTAPFSRTPRSNVPIPGEHMPPGAAVLDFDGDGRPGPLRRRAATATASTATAATGPSRTSPQTAGVARPGGRGASARSRSTTTTTADTRSLRDLPLPAEPPLPQPRRRHVRGGRRRRPASRLNDYCTSAAALDYDRDGDPDLYVLVYGHPDYGPNARGRQRAAQSPLPQQRRRHVHRRHRRRRRPTTPAGALALQSRGPRRRRLARPLRRQRLRQPHLPPQRRRRHVSRTSRRRPASSTRASAWAWPSTTTTATAGSTSSSRTTRSRSTGSCATRATRCRPFPYSLGRPLVWRRLTALSRGSSLFRNLGGDRFERTSDEADVWDTSWSWGCVFVDADLDGRPTSSSSTAWSPARTRPSARSTSGT